MLKEIKINKTYGYTALAALLVIVSYPLAFRHTVTALQLNRELQAELRDAGDLHTQPAYLLRKFTNLNALTGRYQADSTDFRTGVIGNVSAIAEQHRVRLINVPVTDTTLNSQGLLMQHLELSGDFFALLQVYDGLISASYKGLVRSVSIKAPPRSRPEDKVPLTMEVYVVAVK